MTAMCDKTPGQDEAGGKDQSEHKEKATNPDEEPT
jgi:hypothetical protein